MKIIIDVTILINEQIKKRKINKFVNKNNSKINLKKYSIKKINVKFLLKYSK